MSTHEPGLRARFFHINPHPVMPRTLYSPRLSDDVVRALYREGLRRRMPMTRLADELLRDSLCHPRHDIAQIPLVCETQTPPVPDCASNGKAA